MCNSYKGKILISTPDSNIDIFSKSLVYIINHDLDGAFGLILNKKAQDNDAQFIEILENKMDFYRGGPVEEHRIFMMVKGVPLSESYIAINEEYYLTEDINRVILSVLKEEINIKDIKFFQGYSGWSANQLESEINSGFWEVLDVLPFDLMGDTASLWKKTMNNMGGKHLLWANTPEDISLN